MKKELLREIIEERIEMYKESIAGIQERLEEQTTLFECDKNALRKRMNEEEARLAELKSILETEKFVKGTII